MKLTGNLTARVLLKDLADNFVAKPDLLFPTGRLVAGKLIS